MDEMASGGNSALSIGHADDPQALVRPSSLRETCPGVCILSARRFDERTDKGTDCNVQRSIPSRP